MTADTTSPQPAPAAARERPAALLVGVVTTLLVGAVLTAAGLYVAAAGLVGDAPLDRSGTGAAVLVPIGVFILLAGRALLRGRRWGRSPAVLGNAVNLGFAYYMWQGGGLLRGAAVAVAVLGLTGVGAVLHPRVTELLYGDPPQAA